MDNLKSILLTILIMAALVGVFYFAITDYGIITAWILIGIAIFCLSAIVFWAVKIFIIENKWK